MGCLLNSTLHYKLDDSENSPKRHDSDVEVSHSSIIILLHKVCQEMVNTVHINEGDASICRPAQYNMLIDSMRRSIVRLLYKKDKPWDRVYRKNYRPITLQNLDYKIIYKVLAMRLAKVIHKVIPKCQSAFVPTCIISSPTHTIRSIINKYKTSSHKYAVIFMDMEKAYDSVDFAYTLRVLEAVGVPSKFLN